jgi:hypothetical protein
MQKINHNFYSLLSSVRLSLPASASRISYPYAGEQFCLMRVNSFALCGKTVLPYAGKQFCLMQENSFALCG